VTKRIVAALLVLLLAATVGLLVGCGGDLPKSAVAKVGDEVITEEELEARVNDFETQYAGQTPDPETQPDDYKLFQQDVLEYMITYEIASQKAEELGITVTDEEVQKEIDSIRDSSFGGDQAAFDQALAEQNLTVDQLKQGYRESMLLQKVYEDVTKDVTTVPDSEIQAYYDENKDYYFIEETRTARHILLAPIASRTAGTTSTTTTSSTTSTTLGSSDSSSTTGTASSTTAAPSSTTTTAAPTDADWNTALETAKKVRADLVGGADWATEAAKYSDDDGTKNIGGDLSTVYKGQMVQEFEDAVFSLEKDEISEPVKTTYGYHIIQVTGINEAKQYTLEEVKEEIISTLLDTKQKQAWRDWIAEMKQEIGVIYADDWVTTTTTTAAPTATTGGSADTTATTAAGGTTTTVAPSTQTTSGASTTTTAGATITTAGPTTTAKP
jgi:parvulin-like peptidyl-prolyl isomerase